MARWSRGEKGVSNRGRWNSIREKARGGKLPGENAVGREASAGRLGGRGNRKEARGVDAVGNTGARKK